MDEFEVYQRLMNSIDADAHKNLDFDELRVRIRELKPQEHLLKEIRLSRNNRVTLCVGGDPIGVLYSAYT